MRGVIAGLIVGILLLAQVADACWAAPPEVAWDTSESGLFEYKRENKTGVITVYKAGDQQNALWSAKIPEFDSLFSVIYLSNTGKSLLHIRGNHLVNNLSDTAAYVISSDGTSSTYKAETFTSDLVPPQLRHSASPAYMWFNEVEEFTDKSLTIINIKSGRIRIDLKPANRQAKQDASDFPYMLRGYCYAGTKIQDGDALGGFAGSKNLPKAAEGAIEDLKNDVYLLALPEEETTFAESFHGMKVFLINGTRWQKKFDASDSRLSIFQQAKNDKGEWAAIEYLPSSWCGNSYHDVFLGPKEYWEFAAPRYEGSVETTLRFAMLYGKKVIYSNEFAGSINPEQFRVKQGHTPTSIMDPYDE